MNPLKQVCAAFVLTLALAFSAFAGDIETGKASTPPLQPSATQGEISTTSMGDIETPVAATTEIALNLISGVLSLV